MNLTLIFQWDVLLRASYSKQVLYSLGYNCSKQCTLQGLRVLQKAVLIAQERDVSSLPGLFGFAHGWPLDSSFSWACDPGENSGSDFCRLFSAFRNRWGLLYLFIFNIKVYGKKKFDLETLCLCERSKFEQYFSSETRVQKFPNAYKLLKYCVRRKDRL